jgi:hypothetical protein
MIYAVRKQGKGLVLHTKVELTVELLTVDNVEPVRSTCHHVAYFKVEPLVVMVCVDVRVQNQVILVLAYLINKISNTAYFKLGKM